MVCSPLKHAVRLSWCVQGKMTNRVGGIMSQASSSCFYFSLSTGFCQPKAAQLFVSKTNTSMPIIHFQGSNKSRLRSYISSQGSDFYSLKLTNIEAGKQPQKLCFNFSSGCQNMNVKVKGPRKPRVPKTKYNIRSLSWSQSGSSAGLVFGLLVCYSTSESVHAEIQFPDENKGNSSSTFSHGKKVCTNYSVIGIPGDGRCMFRSVAHGACLRSGKGAPDESLQKELADELRARVADEFVKRREETEWFIEGDFETYISQIRKPHVWGGEPELLMASHVLQMPITVYMQDEDSGGLIAIAEYGQEYSKQNPINILYHGFGHYDALQIPGRKGERSKL